MAKLDVIRSDEAGSTGLISFEAYAPHKPTTWEIKTYRDGAGEGAQVLLCIRPKGHANGIECWVSVDELRHVVNLLAMQFPGKSLTERFAAIDKRAGNRLSRLEEDADR